MGLIESIKGEIRAVVSEQQLTRLVSDVRRTSYDEGHAAGYALGLSTTSYAHDAVTVAENEAPGPKMKCLNSEESSGHWIVVGNTDPIRVQEGTTQTALIEYLARLNAGYRPPS
jgi:hypothetical protein